MMALFVYKKQRHCPGGPEQNKKNEFLTPYHQTSSCTKQNCQSVASEENNAMFEL